MLKAYIKYFRGVLQVFYIDVAKVDWDVTYVAMAIMYVSSVCSKCFICFRHMLQVFHVAIAYIYVNVSSIFIHTLQVFSSGSYNVCNGYTHVFKFFWCFKCFRRMLQVFQLFLTYVVNVSSESCKRRSDIAHVEWDLVAAAIYCSC
jgi:hypothetical protein